MTSYDLVFNRFLSICDSYSLLNLSENDFNELATEWLFIAISNVEVRQLFSELELDNEIRAISFKLKDSVDESSDEYFVVDILALAMKIAWLTQRVDAELYTAPFIGSDKEKKILDGHSEMSNRLHMLEVQLQKKIMKHGYFNGEIGGIG